MKIASSAFKNGEVIPARYTCDGDNISPPLKFSNLPKNTKSLVLISDDPDAPAGNWAHWLVWNINPQTTQINENSAPQDAIEGTTSFGTQGYGGPCPPSGSHRYFFKLYALDSILELNSQADKQALEKAMQSHILSLAELVGTYSRK